MEWVEQFYKNQNEWIDCYGGDVLAAHRKNGAIVWRLSGGKTGRLLELGAGGGQNAVAVADLGFSVVTVELLSLAVENARRLAAQSQKGDIRIIEGDFYAVKFDDPFDIVCYWDGFGIGEDVDQQKLLKRIAHWLCPTGMALIEVCTPWYWTAAAGRQMNFGDVSRRYDYDVENGRMLDRWWPVDQEEQAVTQSLRCYAPDDLEMLLKGTGLVLESVEPRGAFVAEKNRFIEDVPLEEAMSFLAVLRLETGNHRF